MKGKVECGASISKGCSEVVEEVGLEAILTERGNSGEGPELALTCVYESRREKEDMGPGS